MTKFQTHQAKWNNCTACPLCEGRRNVVLFRGHISCDVLYIGEAPGASEDVIGSPFVGPAGHLLDEIISKATGDQELRVGYTNLIACIPLGDDSNKVKEPSEESIRSCAPRLQEIVEISKPRLVVFVGKLPAKWFHHCVSNRQGLPTVTITHPAALLRMDGFQQGLAIQQVVVTLRDAFAGLE